MPRIRLNIPREVLEGSLPPVVPPKEGDVVRRIPTGDCVWCGQPTPIRAETPFRPDLGEVPLHLTCSTEIIRVFNEIAAGNAIPIEFKEPLLRLMEVQR